MFLVFLVLVPCVLTLAACNFGKKGGEEETGDEEIPTGLYVLDLGEGDASAYSTTIIYLGGYNDIPPTRNLPAYVRNAYLQGMTMTPKITIGANNAVSLSNVAFNPHDDLRALTPLQAGLTDGQSTRYVDAGNKLKVQRQYIPNGAWDDCVISLNAIGDQEAWFIFFELEYRWDDVLVLTASYYTSKTNKTVGFKCSYNFIKA